MLTSKQEAFCLAYINAESASEAYRLAYESEAMKPETVNRKAFDLLQNGKIAARISELRGFAAKEASYTLADHMDRLGVLSKKAEADGQFAAAIKAEELKGKVSGFYSERVEISGPGGSAIPTIITLVAPNG